jgi:uncharacterized protein (TIGR00106 family)
MSVLLEFSIFPTDKGESVSRYVGPVIQAIRDSGAVYQLTPMGTIIETDSLEQALGLVEQAYRVLERAGCQRVYAALKLDIRLGKEHRLQGKIDAIRARIGEVST